MKIQHCSEKNSLAAFHSIVGPGISWGVWVNGENSHLRLQCSTFTQIFQRCAYEEHLKNKYKFSSQNRIHSFDFTKYANWTKSTVCLHVGVLWNIHISLQQNKHTKHCNSWHSKWKQRIPLQRCYLPVRCINNLLLCYCVSLINQLAKSFRTQTYVSWNDKQYTNHSIFFPMKSVQQRERR